MIRKVFNLLRKLFHTETCQGKDGLAKSQHLFCEAIALGAKIERKAENVYAELQKLEQIRISK